MAETKKFELRVLLTCTTRRLLTKPEGERDNGIGALYELLGWMTNDQPFTHQLPRFNDECQPWLLRWFPELAKAGTASALTSLDVLLHTANCDPIEQWLMEQLQENPELKAEYEVPRIPRDDHTRKNAYDELVEMRGTDAGVALVHG